MLIPLLRIVMVVLLLTVEILKRKPLEIVTVLTILKSLNMVVLVSQILSLPNSRLLLRPLKK